jgi:hypothetical protein
MCVEQKFLTKPVLADTYVMLLFIDKGIFFSCLSYLFIFLFSNSFSNYEYIVPNYWIIVNNYYEKYVKGSAFILFQGTVT